MCWLLVGLLAFLLDCLGAWALEIIAPAAGEGYFPAGLGFGDLDFELGKHGHDGLLRHCPRLLVASLRLPLHGNIINNLQLKQDRHSPCAR